MVYKREECTIIVPMLFCGSMLLVVVNGGYTVFLGDAQCIQGVAQVQTTDSRKNRYCRCDVTHRFLKSCFEALNVTKL